MTGAGVNLIPDPEGSPHRATGLLEAEVWEAARFLIFLPSFPQPNPNRPAVWGARTLRPQEDPQSQRHSSQEARLVASLEKKTFLSLIASRNSPLHSPHIEQSESTLVTISADFCSDRISSAPAAKLQVSPEPAQLLGVPLPSGPGVLGWPGRQ